jgi:hypothetical protein
MTKLKDEIEVLESMVDKDTIIDFEDDGENSLMEKPCKDMVILDASEKQSQTEAPDTAQDMIDDYHYARETYTKMIQQGQEVLTGVLEMAQAAPNPRAFEVAGQHMKIIADNTDKLMKIAKEYKELTTEKQSGTEQNAENITNNNIVFNGSADQLLRMLEEEEVDIIDHDE